MKEPIPTDIASLKKKLNRDTAKIKWPALDEYQAQGFVLEVSHALDLIEVACAFAQDDHENVKSMLGTEQINRVATEKAQTWKASDQEMWAVVVVPWVLVQLQKPD